MNIKDWDFKRLPDFDHHVRTQLPWYDQVTAAVALIARHYIPVRGLVYDIGASTGNVGRAIAATLEERDARLIAIECAPNMIEAYQAPGEIHHGDALDFAYEPFDVAILFLTLMFMPVAARGAFVSRLRQLMRPGGALIIVDKCVQPAGYEGVVNARLTLAGKLQAAVPGEDIVTKEIALAGIQRPLSITELGDDAIEMFRYGDFAGWIVPAG